MKIETRLNANLGAFPYVPSHHLGLPLVFVEAPLITVAIPSWKLVSASQLPNHFQNHNFISSVSSDLSEPTCSCHQQPAEAFCKDKMVFTEIIYILGVPPMYEIIYLYNIYNIIYMQLYKYIYIYVCSTDSHYIDIYYCSDHVV